MRQWRHNYLTGLLLLAQLAGCTASTPARDSSVVVGESWQPCEGERPRVCTMIYDPVCGRRGDGSLETYASPCNACADVAVGGRNAPRLVSVYRATLRACIRCSLVHI